MDIHALTPERLHDFLSFFDDVAFSDHKEWSWCYCTFFHLGCADEKRIEEEHKDILLRNNAIRLVNDATIQGYLAYEDGAVIGWLNANDKKNYAKLCERAELWDDTADARTKAVTCFIVAPQMRRKGLATALLDRAIADAALAGYDFIEAYPANGALDCFQHYHGHPQMYEAHGFACVKVFEYDCLYRKALK